MGAAAAAPCCCESLGDGEPVKIVPAEPSADLLYSVRLTREDGQKLGVLVNTRSTTERLRVVAVEAGSAAHEWNNLYPKTPLRIGDCIIKVNGFTGDAISLLKQCRDVSCLQLTLMRAPCGDETPPAQAERSEVEDLEGQNLSLDSNKEVEVDDDDDDVVIELGLGASVTKPTPSEWQSPKPAEATAEAGEEDDNDFGSPVGAPLKSIWQAPSAESTQADDDDSRGFGSPVGVPTKSTWSPPSRGGC